MFYVNVQRESYVLLPENASWDFLLLFAYCYERLVPQSAVCSHWTLPTSNFHPSPFCWVNDTQVYKNDVFATFVLFFASPHHHISCWFF